MNAISSQLHVLFKTRADILYSSLYPIKYELRVLNGFNIPILSVYLRKNFQNGCFISCMIYHSLMGKGLGQNWIMAPPRPNNLESVRHCVASVDQRTDSLPSISRRSVFLRNVEFCFVIYCR